jgi:phosphate transport system substrate-binding protein
MRRSWVALSFVVLFAALATGAWAKGMIQVKGSDTLINVAQRLAEVYMGKHPGTVIGVTGGGSGTGIAALINGKCDIADASRLMKKEEFAQAQARGVRPSRIVIAVDRLCLIVNAKNPVSKLTVDQLGKMFRGEVKNWEEVGGENGPVTLYGRQSNSGTYDFFMEYVLKGNYSNKMNQMNGNAQIVEAVRQDASGIGYVGVGYVRQVKGITVLKVASKAGGYYSSPLNEGEVESGKYPISRPLQQYVNGQPSGALRDLIEFELSQAGQQVVKEEGFFTLPAEYQQLNKKAGF